MYGIYRVGDVTTATQMVWMVVELHLLVCVALLEVILCSSRQSSCLRSFQAAVIAAEALTIDIVVVVLAIVRHCKGCLLFFYFICHIYIHFSKITNCDFEHYHIQQHSKVVLLAFKPLLHNPFLKRT